MKKIFLSLIALSFCSPLFSQTDTGLFPGEAAYSPDALNRLYIVGLQYLTEGELTQAEIAFRSIIAFPLTSQDWRVTRFYKGKAHYYLGDIYFIQKKYLAASSNYRSVGSEYTDIEEYTASIFKLGRSLVLGERYRDGIEILRNYYVNYGGIDGYADNALFWIARGHLEGKEYLPALKYLEQILAEYPDSAIAYDVRILIAQIKSEQYEDILYSKATEDIQDKTAALEAKKEMASRMDNLLQLKERLLTLQERKLELLDKVSRARDRALKSRQVYANPDSRIFPEN
ncbi:MAG: tetratricopeptide repeat protein [Brevinema sp.]